jgi:hypothetical protein
MTDRLTGDRVDHMDHVMRAFALRAAMFLIHGGLLLRR